MKISFGTIVFIILGFAPFTSSYINKGIPRVQLEEDSLEIEIDSTTGLSMKSLFGSDYEKKITSYQLQGLSPCIAQNPFLTLKDLYTYKDEELSIIDFTILDENIFYITFNQLKSINSMVPAYDPTQKAINLVDISSHYFSYINAFKLGNDDIIIFLSNEKKNLSYLIIDQATKKVSPISTTENYFEEFTDDMKMAVLENYVLIPAGKKGVVVYVYNITEKILVYKGILKQLKDARDIVLKRSQIRNSIVAIVADYEQGLITLDIAENTIDEHLEYDIVAEIADAKREFINAKFVTMFKNDNEDNLLLITDAVDGSSKYILLTVDLGNIIDIMYYQIKLIDGVDNFGDSGEGFFSVILPNSVMIIKANQLSSSIMGYITKPGVNNAKLLKLSDSVDPYVIYGHKNEIVAVQLKNSGGFLLCQTPSIPKTYKFNVLGSAKSCRVLSRTLDRCYYDLALTIDIVDYKELNKLKTLGIIVGSIAAVLVILIAIILTIYCCKFRSAKKKYFMLLKDTNRTNDQEMPAEKNMEFKAAS